MSRLAGLALVALACAHAPDPEAPIGSYQNPVRCTAQADEADYLARLRCPDGSAAQWRKVGAVRAGPRGTPLDRFQVRCSESDWETSLYFDPRHTPPEDSAPPPGLELGPAIAAPSCRPPGHCR